MTPTTPAARTILTGFGAMAVAGMAALTLRALHAGSGERVESFVAIVLAVLAVVLAAVVGASLLRRGESVSPGAAALATATAVVVGLAAIYLFRATFFVTFRGDFLIWSESDFVNDILKLRVGYPLYSPEVNNDSFFYTPGAQVLTYLLAAGIGQADSIPVYRAMQLVYTLAASLMGLACWRLLVRHLPGSSLHASGWWPPLVAGFLFLCATNSLTNPFNQFLHNDALAQFVSVLGFWLLLLYALEGRRTALWGMALIPAAGFMVKQSLLIWAPLFVGYLVFFDRPRSWKKIAVFSIAAGAAAGAMIGGGWVLWGPHFQYWAFDALASHTVAPLRSLRHLLDAWSYFAIGLVAGWVVLSRSDRDARLAGLWAVWLVLLSVETYTSGVGWMRNHMGPGSLIAGIWFAAAVPSLCASVSWPGTRRWQAAGGAAIAVGLFTLLLQGLGTVRVPLPPLPSDADRYASAIEAEFAGAEVSKVLLDMGTWPYVASGTVMKDRAPAVGERGYSQTGDFSCLLARLKQQHYDKILVRNYRIGDFWYDHEMWSTSSGIRDAMETYYQEIRIIPRVQTGDGQAAYGFGDISVLVPRPDSTSREDREWP